VFFFLGLSHFQASLTLVFHPYLVVLDRPSQSPLGCCPLSQFHSPSDLDHNTRTDEARAIHLVLLFIASCRNTPYRLNGCSPAGCAPAAYHAHVVFVFPLLDLESGLNAIATP